MSSNPYPDATPQRRPCAVMLPDGRMYAVDVGSDRSPFLASAGFCSAYADFLAEDGSQDESFDGTPFEVWYRVGSTSFYVVFLEAGERDTDPPWASSSWYDIETWLAHRAYE